MTTTSFLNLPNDLIIRIGFDTYHDNPSSENATQSARFLGRLAVTNKDFLKKIDIDDFWNTVCQKIRHHNFFDYSLDDNESRKIFAKKQFQVIRNWCKGIVQVNAHVQSFSNPVHFCLNTNNELMVIEKYKKEVKRKKNQLRRQRREEPRWDLLCVTRRCWLMNLI